MKYIKSLLGIVLFCVISLGLSVNIPEKFQQTQILEFNDNINTSLSIDGNILSFSLGDKTFAEYGNIESSETTIAPVKDKSNIVDILNDLLKMLYLILWPLLFIAGLAVDNSLVYAEIFNFDKILWEIWNIMKDLANFSLFFIALYNILKYLYQSKANEIQGVVKKLLIAGVLIQGSWFLMGAIIDISTISIIGVGSLPSIASSNNSNDVILQTPILQPHIITYNTSEDGDGKQQTFRYFSYGKKNIAECSTHLYKHRYYIVGREKFLPGEISETIIFQKDVCSDGRSVYKFKEHNSIQNLTDKQKYKDQINVFLKNPDKYNIPKLIETGKDTGILLLMQKTQIVTGDVKFGVIPDNHDFFTKERDNGGKTVEKILREAKGYVGSFITLYSSLLGYSDLGAGDEVKTGDNYRVFGDFIRKTVFSLLLFIPLVSMVVVLILRIGVLRLAIVFLPFLVIKRVFFKDSKASDFIDTHFKRPNLLSIIFAPVVMVFALSLSIIFIQAVTEDIDTSISKSQFATEIKTCKQTDVDCDCPGGEIDFFGLISLCDKGANLNKGKNIFAEIIENLFALGVMWFLLFAAIKTNSIGQKIGGAIQKTAQKMFGTIPIFPVPGGGIGWNTFKNEMVDGNAAKRIVNQRNTQDMNKLKKVLPGVFGEVSTSIDGLDSKTTTNLYWQRAGGATGTAMLADSSTLNALNKGGTNLGRGDGTLLEEKLDAGLSSGLQGNDFDKKILEHLSEGKEAKALFEDKQYIYELNKRKYGQNDDEKFITNWEQDKFGTVLDNTAVIRSHLEDIEKEIVKKDTKINAMKASPDHNSEDLTKLIAEKETLEKKKKYLKHKENSVLSSTT